MAAPAPLKPDPLLTASDPFIVPLVVAVPAGLLWLLCAGVLLTVPEGRLAAAPDEPIVAAGRLVVAEPALLIVPDAGAVNVPDGRLAAAALSLIVGVVLTTEDLPLEMLFVSVPLTAVTRLGAVLPVVD